MKTNVTHKILVAISREAVNRGFRTTLEYDHGEWSLYIFGKGSPTWFDRNTKIRDIERWMKKIDMTWKSEIAPTNDKMSKLSIVETDAAGAAVVEARLAFGEADAADAADAAAYADYMTAKAAYKTAKAAAEAAEEAADYDTAIDAAAHAAYRTAHAAYRAARAEYLKSKRDKS